MLAIAQEKDYGDCAVELVRSDAYALKEVEGVFDAALVGFWWSHVPKQRLGDFLGVLHSKLAAGARVVVLDNRYVEGSSTPIARRDEQGNTYQIRTLMDGSEHEVVKNFAVEAEFVREVGDYGAECEFSMLEYFWLGRYRVKKR